MCTLTAVPGAWLAASDGAPLPALRVVFNRDERRTRRPSGPPQARDIEGRQAMMPIDTDGGGTWIAATDAGIVFALLNVTEHVSEGVVSTAPSWPGRTTRGAIIPALAGSRDLDDAARRAVALDPTAYAPFHLVCASAAGRLDARSDGATLSVRRTEPTGAWMRASSGLGDCRVIGPRRQLFDAWFRERPFTREVQDRFHRHCWDAHRPLSVWMSRPDARTVSITTVELRPGGTTMDYEPVAGDGRRNAEGGMRNAERMPWFRIPRSAFRV